MKTLEFIFDFASPNAYLAYRALTPLLDRNGATLTITPCLLGGIFKATGNQAPMLAFANVKGKLAYDQIEINRFIEKHKLTEFVFNSHFPINTLMMMRGAMAAEQDSQLIEYIEAGLRHMWEDNLDMNDANIYKQAMNEAGFDGAALLQRIQDDEIKARLIRNTEQAVNRGCFGIPTFFIGNEMFFGKERLAQIEEALG